MTLINWRIKGAEKMEEKPTGRDLFCIVTPKPDGEWELGELLSIATCKQRMIVHTGHCGRQRDDCVHHRSNNGRDYKEQAHTDT